jgi:hypothetical protein
MSESEDTSQIYSRKESFITNQIKLGLINEPLYWTAAAIIFLVNYKTDRNIFIAIFTFYAVTSWSYFTHLLSHTKLFMPLGQIHLLHHDPKYNEMPAVYVTEALIDFFLFGGFILIFVGLFIENMFEFRIFNYYIILVWAIFYLTYHLFNYHITKPDAHKQHHIDNGSNNYGPEWMDIYFDTKTEGSVFENLNSGIINLIVATGIVLGLKDTKYDLTHIFDGVIARIF